LTVISGLPLVKRLIHEGNDISILDLRHPSPSDLDYLRNASTPSFDISSFVTQPLGPARKLGKLSIITADVRHAKQVTNIFQRETAGFEGIIHLAGVARNTWCTEREEECHKLNVEGTELIYRSAVDSTPSDVQPPWFIYASSLDVYGYQGELGAGKMNALGRTKWAAERTLKTAHEHAVGEGKVSPVAVLRLGTTFGSPIEFKDRLLPAVVERAMMEMPLQIMDSDEVVDLMRIEDAMEGFVGAIKLLQKKRDQYDLASSMDDDSLPEEGVMPPSEDDKRRQLGSSAQGYWDEFDVVTGSTLTPRELLNIVMAATRSSSPIQDFSGSRQKRKPGPYRRKTPAVDPRLEAELGFKPQIPFEIGLAAYIHEQQAKFVDWSSQYLRDKCPGSKYGNPTTIPEADRRNQRLDRLLGCSINMGVNHNGWVHHMKCGEQDGVTCQADNIKRDAYNWNQTVFNIVSPSIDNISPLANDLLDKRRVHSRDISGRALSVQFEEENTKMLLGFERNRGGAVNSSQTVHFKLYSKKDARRSEIVTEFEPRVRRAGASASRTLPADLAVFMNYADSNQRFVLTARRYRYQ
jgi:nucleoside-diphosphate-sugar epimerase